MLDLTIADDLAAADVAVALGCVQCHVAVSERVEALDAALAAEITRWQHALSQGPVAELPPIAAARRAYKTLGKDPSRYRVSSEALLRRIGQGKALYRVNSVVDVNNLVSLHGGFSVGSYRIESLAPPVVFRKGRPGESYPAIGRGPLNLENLPLFADEEGPFGSPTSDSERSMITLDTESVLMVVIAFGDARALGDQVDFAARCLERYSRATGVETAVVTQ
jgi:DNA/RNA-binding domain of Phe-tRNA-synthetase-like protein